MSTPVQEVPARAVNRIERRFYPRISPQAPIFFKFGECEGAMLLNVGENGLLISTPNELACNCVTHLVIPLNGLPSAVCVTARVVWVNEARKLAGVQLLDLSEHDRERIRMWGAQALPQRERVELEHFRLGASSSIELTEFAGTASSPESESVAEDWPGLPPLVPPLVIEARAPSGVARRVAFGLLLAVVGLGACLAAAAFGAKKAAVGSLLARFIPNRLVVSAAPPPHQISTAMLGTPEISSRAVTNAVASSAAFETAANPGVVIAGIPSHPDSPKPASEADRTPNIPRQKSSRWPGTANVQPEIAAVVPAADVLPAANRTPADPAAFSAVILNPLPIPKESFSNLLPSARPLAIVAPASSSNVLNPATGSPISSSAAASAVQTGSPRPQVLEVRMPPAYRPFLFNLPGERTLVSPSVTIRVQRSIRIPASHAAWAFNRSKKVIVGNLISRVNPMPAQVPAGVDDSVRVRAVVAKDGSVKRVTPVFGSAALIPAVATALHEWRYQPTLVDGKPVETLSYIVIQFHESPARTAH